MIDYAVYRPRAGERVLHAPGGFTWWYLDLLDHEGNGLVFLWFFGLPLLPGARKPHVPAGRPGFSLAVYRAFQPSFYLLQEHEPGASSWDPESSTWRFGRTMVRQVGSSGWLVSLDASLPGTAERVRGEIVVTGGPCTPGARLAGAVPSGEHVWSPLLLGGRGEAELELGAGERCSLRGRAYVDHNASGVALHALGIRSWRWSRLSFAGRDLVYYLVDPVDPHAPRRDVVLTAAGGRVDLVEGAELRFTGARRSLYGLRWHERAHLTDGGGLDVALRVRGLVDDGPFYLRFLVEGRDARSGEVATGVAELLTPPRVDLPWQRPFVRMRHHRPAQRNSVWLPLFTGPRRGRVGRLLGQLTRRHAPSEALA